MKFLADEGVDSSIVKCLRKTGHDVIFVVERTLRTMEDDLLLQIAESENRIIITRDKDFGELVFRLKKTHTGVLLIRLEGYNTEERGRIVCMLINKYNDQLKGAFSVIQRGIIRIRN